MTVLAFLALVLVTVGWVALPLIPALREFFRPTDVEPLTMVGRDNADISRFARHFRDYLQGELARLEPASAPGDRSGRLPDGTPFVRLARLPNEMTRTQLPPSAGGRLVVMDQVTVLDGGEQFRLEVWAREDFIGGPAATYRAILGERNVEVGEDSVSLRWLHSVGTLVVGPRCHLYGRTSSETAIRLGARVGFDRLGAPVIAAGGAMAASPQPARNEAAALFTPPESRRLGDHVRVDGDVMVPPGSAVEGNLVAAGSVTIGKGARVTGSLKAHRDLVLESGAVIEGAAVSRGAMVIGTGAWVRGPVIAEQHVEVGGQACVGHPGSPTTLSARTVTLHSGATVCGQIVTEEGGQTGE